MTNHTQRDSLSRTIAILGAGTIGSSITKLFAHQGLHSLLVIDSFQGSLDALSHLTNVTIHNCDIHDKEALKSVVKNVDIIVSALAYHDNIIVAEIALEIGASYFDLTEDIATSEAIKTISEKASHGQSFVPQCGLAPGFISILAHHIYQQFDTVESLRLRVGALPEYPSNLMMYNLTWSTDGLINEYCNPCYALKNHQFVELMPLEGLENFSLDGMEYEAFNTSGGLGTLSESLKDCVRDLDYKTIRYKGHQYLMDFLINGLKLGERKQLLRKIFENAVATTRQDVVIIVVSAIGTINGQLSQITNSRKIYHNEVMGEHWGEIQITTAASLCAVVQMFIDSKLPNKTFIKQEEIDFHKFMDSPMARYYQTQEDLP